MEDLDIWAGEEEGIQNIAHDVKSAQPDPGIGEILYHVDRSLPYLHTASHGTGGLEHEEQITEPFHP